jgi:hypothetical protein
MIARVLAVVLRRKPRRFDLDTTRVPAALWARVMAPR